MISRSSPPAGPVRSGTRREARGAAGPSDPAVTPSHSSGRGGTERSLLAGRAGDSSTGFAPSRSPRSHARETRALTSDQFGAGEETPAPTGPELVPAHPSLPDPDPGISWPEAICKVCRSLIRRNEVLGIRYCPVEPHGTSKDFLYWSRSHKAYVEV